MAALAILSKTSSVFNRFCCFFLHFIDFGEHFIVIKRNLKFGEKEDEKNGYENLQLLYYLCYMVKSGIGGFPNPWPLQICKSFPTKIIIFEEKSRFLCLIDFKNRL